MRSVVVIAFTLILTSTAAAQPSLTPVERDQPETESYRGWVLGTGGAAVGMMLLGAAAEGPNGRDTEASNLFFGMGAIGYILSGPIVHAAQGEGGRAFGSLAVRVMVPSVTGAIAVGMNDCDSSEDWFCELDYLGYGIVVGMATAVVIDGLWVAKEKRTVSQPYVAPYAAPAAGGGTVGLSGAF